MFNTALLLVTGILCALQTAHVFCDGHGVAGILANTNHSNPPFGVMQPESVNPVATLPSSTESTPEPPPTRFSVHRSSRERRQVALELAKDHNKDESYPTSEIMATYTVTHVPVSARRKREHNFMLPGGVNTTQNADQGAQPKGSHRKRRQAVEGGIDEATPVSAQPTPFHKPEVTLVPPTNANLQPNFVDFPNQDETRKASRGHNVMAKREITDKSEIMANRDNSQHPSTGTTVRKTTTEDTLQEQSRSQGGTGLATPGTFLTGV